MARRDDREYWEYLREEQRSQSGCLARKMLVIQLLRATNVRARSELYSHAQLHLSRRGDGVAHAPEAREHRLVVGGSRKRDELRRCEVGAVEEVERFDPQLEVPARTERRPRSVFDERDVNSAQVGPDEITATRVAERAGPRQRKGRRVEPLVRVASHSAL